MLSLLRLLKILPVLVFVAAPQGGEAQDASPWSTGHRSRVRLVAGGEDGHAVLAGVEIALEPGFKTYWRSPGESGLPPSFDWSKSANAKAIEVLWPAPSRSEDAGGVSYGYSGGVLFPVRISPAAPGKPVNVALRIDYGVCKDICIPARADLSLTLPQKASPASRALIETALARVPRPQPLGAASKLAVVDARIVGGDTSKLLVTIRAPAGSKPAIFVEGPDNWVFQPTPNATQTAARGAKQSLSIDVLERPPEQGPVDLRFTVVAGDQAVETTARLDAARLTR